MADPKKARGGLRPKASNRDDSIMGTNNSSIVSKRSVERLYYPDEPHFFRYFVKKPQRRAPLINRGYWLRMKAIDHVVRRFLDEGGEKKKIVVNLGCGYDPLPWQCWARYPEQSKNVTFVDIDYRDLILRKRDMVERTPELSGVLGDFQVSDDGDVLLRSERYLQVGCDLRDLTRLEEVLKSEFGLENCVVFCTAEVSIAYMDVAASDALIKWVGALPEARFCLLEQLIPHGPDHPFAKTMLAHFDKLQTPLRPVLRYPTAKDQEMRFRNAGWADVHARNLWELWGSSGFLSPEERMGLDEVEPFDEWEEFALFGCHYTLLVASNRVPSVAEQEDSMTSGMNASSLPINNATSLSGEMTYMEYPKTGGIRRFAAPLSMRGPNAHPDLKGNFGGIGLNARLDSIDVFTGPSENGLFNQGPVRGGPSSRVCHTITDIGDVGSLLVGGRTSPDRALADCWLYSKLANTWERVDDLPVPCYRHVAVAVGNGSVLVTGGKRDSRTVLCDTFVWNRQTGWVRCVESWRDQEDRKQPRVFGALMGLDSAVRGASRRGFLTGGITVHGLISTDIWCWEWWPESDTPLEAPSMEWKLLDESITRNALYLARFGASVANYDGEVVVVGGIGCDDLIPESWEAVVVSILDSTTHIDTSPIKIDGCSPRPLLVGHSVTLSGRSLLIMGGGAVCFSFGTFWNKGCYTLCLPKRPSAPSRSGIEPGSTPNSWKYLKTIEMESASKTETTLVVTSSQQLKAKEPTVIRRTKISSASDFAAILASAQPLILETLDLGSCTHSWTNEYLLDRIGRDRQVVVHQATTDHMDFVSKNFDYTTKTFGEFMEAIGKDEKLYLRSLAADKPSEQPADLSRDFPTISEDFCLPPELAVANENKHSSPLRISGPVSMWLHYDVMSNVLCQIRGTKRLLLFPPSDVQYFDFAPGASSSSIDAFAGLDDAKFAATSPYEAIMNPGDVLFLPPLWLHTAQPLEGVSVSVNVFFRGLQSGYAAGKDVYGNRDLQAYEKGRQDVGRISRSFDNLPADVRKFYLLRLADELTQKARSV